MNNTQHHDAISNRLRKRYAHLKQWVKTHDIEFFRLFDRDIPQAPFIIDALPNHWLVWVCDHQLNPADQMALVTCISNTLNDIQKKSIIFKSRQKNKSRFIPFNHADQTVIIKENGIQFELNLTRYLDIGLFIDHRLTREWVMRHSKNRHVLNLFSYTGSFSCYALAGQASQVTSVDLNPTYSRWHERHCKMNGFDPSRYQIICADVNSFLNQDLKTYDMIICDPPSFSHSKRNGVSRFHIQENGQTLLLSCLNRLTSSGTLLFSTNYRGFNMEKLCLPPMYMIKEVTRQFCPKDFQNKPHTRTWKITASESRNDQL